MHLSDLESGQSKNSGRKNSVISKEDELKVAPGSPGHASSAHQNSNVGRGSRGFTRWFDRHAGVRESTEDMGLVYVEHTFSVERTPRTPES